MEYAEIRSESERVLALLSRYLNLTPDAIRAEQIYSILGEENPKTEERVFAILLASFCGLDIYRNREDKELFRRYFLPAVRRLDPAEYENDLYHRLIRIPEVSRDGWELSTKRYRPYEAFVRDDPARDFAGRVIPSIGYFPREYRYPAVLEGGREWMLITPNEINTMKAPIAASHGRVLTFGLGLGYFALHASEKPEVTEVTVVERDERVIGLFREYILPQFPHRDKLRVVRADAFAYAGEHLGDGFDTVFTDLWHDPSDGISLYRRMKRLAADHPGPDYHYWIEKTLKIYGA